MFWNKIISFESIPSTNSFLLDHYAEYDDLTLVEAVRQTNGRGRKGRVWHSDENSLTFSFLLKDKKYLEKYKEISILMAYGLIRVLEEYGLKASIKWPNDVYAKGRKIAGILLQGIAKERLECLIVGIGINVNNDRFEDEFLREPTSLKIELDKDIDQQEFRDKVYDSILRTIVSKEDFYEDISSHDYLKGQEAYALVSDEKRKVRVIGIDRDYSLKIETEGKTMNIDSGEISFHL